MRTFCIVTIGCFAIACTSSNPSPGGGSGNNNPAPAPASEGGTTEVVNGCTSFTDMTAGNATIEGPMDFNPVQFAPNCVQVKVGQTVTWHVDFAAHPLAASGGTTPSPIATTSTGTSVSFTFSQPGTFGYHCLAHPTIMFGAVLVTP